MAQIIGVRFKEVGKVYYFDPCGIQTTVGQHVIVETARGVEYGEVAIANRDVAEGEVTKPLKKLLRVATHSDEKVVEKARKGSLCDLRKENCGAQAGYEAGLRRIYI